MIKSPNYTQIPNEYFDKIMGTLNGSENIIFLAIMRKTFGWQKVKDKVSYTQLEKITGIGSYSTIKKSLSALEEKGLIISEKTGKCISYEVNIETTTETVEIENKNDYRNCSDTITETVAIMPETTTETVDTKETNINKLIKENAFKEIYDTYISEYEKIFRKKPVILYSNISKMIKKLLQEITKDQIIGAIKTARIDNFCSKVTPFELSIILSDKVISRLINECQNTVFTKPISLKEKQVCPKCAAPVEFGQCTSCGIFVGLDGKEVIL